MANAQDTPLIIEAIISGSSFSGPTWETQSIHGIQTNDFEHEYALFAVHSNASVKTNKSAIYPLDFAEEFIYERTWLTESKIAFGLLTATKIEFISFWNAYTDRSVTLNSIGGYLDWTGVSIDDSSLPDTYTPTDEGIYTLTVTLLGATVLNCYFFFEHTGPEIHNRLTLTGFRNIFLPFNHNWDSHYKIDYSTETIISTTPKLYEQRRPLLPTMKRNIATIDLLPEAIKMRNLLKAYINQVISFPIITEQMTINLVGSLEGLTVLPVNETISDFWNLAHATHVVLWNTLTNETEICALTSYTTSLLLATAIIADWDADDVIIYPVMFCVLTDISIKHNTDKIDEISLKAKEFDIYVT